MFYFFNDQCFISFTEIMDKRIIIISNPCWLFAFNELSLLPFFHNRRVDCTNMLLAHTKILGIKQKEGNYGFINILELLQKKCINVCV